MKKNISKFKYDFAISYAGEEEYIAQRIFQSIKEKHGNYSIFLASKEKHQLIGQDGEDFFKNLFKNSKQVIVILSENYKRKEWTRYEWDIIRERSIEHRCIPIMIGDIKILGLPSHFIYLPFSNNFEEIASLCIKKLLLFEYDMGIIRETDFQKMVNDLRSNSRGAVDKAFQLVVDNRQRTPLENIYYPTDNYNKSYKIISEEDFPSSVITRLKIKIDLPDNLNKDEVVFNIKHCTVYIFNKKKPDALIIFIYSQKASNFQGFENKFNVAKAEFAPYGDWDQAQEGFVYNLPSNKFDWNIEFEESYFDKSKKMKTADECARDLILEILKNKNKNE